MDDFSRQQLNWFQNQFALSQPSQERMIAASLAVQPQPVGTCENGTSTTTLLLTGNACRPPVERICEAIVEAAGFELDNYTLEDDWYLLKIVERLLTFRQSSLSVITSSSDEVHNVRDKSRYKFLIEEFERNRYPSTDRRRAIAQKFNVSPECVANWFGVKRYRTSRHLPRKVGKKTIPQKSSSSSSSSSDGNVVLTGDHFRRLSGMIPKGDHQGEAIKAKTEPRVSSSRDHGRPSKNTLQ